MNRAVSWPVSVKAVASAVSKALAHLGGMSPELSDTYVQHRGPYIKMALVMVFTAMMATLSASFAVSLTGLIPDPVGVVLFGGFWGLGILALDSLLVATMKRHPAGGWRNLVNASLAALPRALVALLIGIVISEPLMLQVFAPEIARQMKVDSSREQAIAMAQIDAEYKDIPELEAKVEALQLQASDPGFYDPVEVNPSYASAKVDLGRTRKACAAARKAASREAAGQSGTHRVGYGSQWRALEDTRKAACAAYTRADERFDRIANETELAWQNQVQAEHVTAARELDRLTNPSNGVLTLRRAAKEAAVDRYVGSAAHAEGLLARAVALDNLTAQSLVIGAYRWGLALLLIAIELLPIINKWLRTVGPPDATQFAEMERDRVHVATEKLRVLEKESAAQLELVSREAAARARRAEAEVQVKAAELAGQARLDEARADAQGQAAMKQVEQQAAQQAAKVRASIQAISAQDWLTRQAQVERELNARAVEVSRAVETAKLEKWRTEELAKSQALLNASGSQTNGHAPQTPPVSVPGLPQPQTP
ncbi:MAG TPA: DUF4407 domain-containing protein [Propionicimonas sp.]|nr:DUF4407 domain-containing protein [Propionicimonas sp.]